MYLRDRCCVALPPDLDKGIEPCGLCGHDGRGRAAHVPCKGKGIPRVRGVGVGVGDGERKRKQVCQRGREERREKREKREKRREKRKECSVGLWSAQASIAVRSQCWPGVHGGI